MQTPTGRDAPAAGAALPTGTVTFLFTDIEGSTKLVERLGTAAWTTLLEAHQSIIRAALAAATGVEVKTEGDSFFAVFTSAETAVAAAAAMQRGLYAHGWPADAAVRVRMGLHTGEGVIAPDADYVGLDVHRAARVSSAAHGGQVVLSDTTRALVAGALPEGATLRDLGEHRLKDLSRPERISQLVISGVPDEFPPLRTLDATPNNLPVMLTDFIGREAVLAEAHPAGGHPPADPDGPGRHGQDAPLPAARRGRRRPLPRRPVLRGPRADQRPGARAVDDRHGHRRAGCGRRVGGGSPARLPAQPHGAPRARQHGAGHRRGALPWRPAAGRAGPDLHRHLARRAPRLRRAGVPGADRWASPTQPTCRPWTPWPRSTAWLCSSSGPGRPGPTSA